ncbi:hypothetical protein [Rhizobium rhizogenes]|uniref:Uncharacterized protein n=1 Tax=Rhizobium rhizogenes (strain K84 / ATCC BAA-868) TaxID=311403 RepID=B9JP00_RHIR8|nr:conserved hypothetical protein [Rhizobium rhizogenes K84]
MQTHDAVANTIMQYIAEGPAVSLWSKSVAHALKNHNFDQTPYPTSQFMEPSLLTEAAAVVGLSSVGLQTFTYSLGREAATVKWLFENVTHATPVQKVNLAYSLATTARYQLAREVLSRVEVDRLFAEEAFAFLMVKFAVDNRLGETALHAADFRQMADLLKSGSLAGSYALDAAAQAIVWRTKAQSIPVAIVDELISMGFEAADGLGTGKHFREHISLSCFHRAYAMIPAAQGDAELTRHHMIKADEFAQAAEPKTVAEQDLVLNAKKTVLESRLKEYLYVRNDIPGAKAVGEELVAFDPHWSISLHELAEVCRKAGDIEQTKVLYEKALNIGLPRKSFAQFKVGVCQAELDDIDGALSSFSEVLLQDQTNVAAGINGYKVAQANGHANADYFRAFLVDWKSQGMLPREYWELV